MASPAVVGSGTREQPWVLKTPPGTSEFQMYRDETLNPPALVCTVGKTELRYHSRCLEDLHAMLKARGDWMPLGSADEQKPAAEGTVEAWGARLTTPSAAGTDSRRACAAASGCTCRRSWKFWAWPRWSTTPRTTACAHSEAYPA